MARIIFLLLLAGCVSVSNEPYTSYDKESVKDTGMEITVVVATFHLYDDSDVLNMEHVRLNYDHERIRAWSKCRWDEKNNVSFCDIYVLRPEFVYTDKALEALGHEMWHGVAGRFHR